VARRRKPKSSAPALLLWAVAIFVLGAIAGTLAQTRCDWKGLAQKVQKTDQEKDQKEGRGDTRPAAKQAKRPAAAAPSQEESAPKQQQPQQAQQPAQQKQQLAQAPPPRIALVIDDLGQADPALVRRLCALNIPLTVAVLPFLPHSKESARVAKAKGAEVILHMPMEPLGYPGPGKDPGRGAVLFDQTEADVRKNVARAIADTPHAVGLNNHMGSRITPDRARMAWVLGEVKKSGLYFLDSRTEKDTVALDVARELGVPALARKVFLDDSLDAAEMARQWERAVAMARNDPCVVVIGHIHLETIEFLERTIPAAKGGMAFAHASAMAR
jgi:polysaccharide deacetylase 2 family uncharacterized protein YibQ